MSNNNRNMTFQQSTRPCFQERTVGEKHREKQSHADKTYQNRRPFPQEKSHQSNTLAKAELSLNKAGKEQGKVKVIVKNAPAGLQPKIKKTGPLSPRAPEKIKKNRSEEMKVYGENACLALFDKRPESIIRVWATVQMSHKIGEVLSYLAVNKKVYHIVDNTELNLVSGSEHHGGICILVKKSYPLSLSSYLKDNREEDCIIFIEGVRNPQNIGGIIRTCAFYGIKNIIIDEPELVQSANAMRVAEGGTEYIRILQTDFNACQQLAQLRHLGYQIVHTTLNKQAGILSNQVRLKNKTVFVLSEKPTESLIERDDILINLSASNPLKNGLNVAVQIGILLAKWNERQNYNFSE
ncbi:TrmH family RNA methyltransferase [Rodentibacter caecimuris]|uniref:rRNA methyltransferase n=1 Tax=Rodentibacter caecimuris TaxID=1796644 RepID=A0ABX3KYK0_9PAST|nr:rRNA methyltransferase [Rodentibacter heylii]